MSTPDDFDRLRKLLALKRYEQPPPGYFDNLHRRITARLEMEPERESWWSRWVSGLVLKPSAAYGTALAVCLLMFAGATVFWKQDRQTFQAERLEDVQLATPLAPTNDQIPMMTLSPGLGDDLASSNEAPFFPELQLRIQPASYDFGR